MLGFYSICLLAGISLASNVAGWSSGLLDVDSDDFVEMLEVVKKHQDVCQDLLLVDELKTCSAVAKDLAKLDVVVANMTAQAALIYADGVKIVAKFNSCGFKLINKQIKCLESVYTSAVALVSKAKEEFTEFETEIETLVSQIEADIETCTSDSLSERFVSLLSQCKSRLV